MSKGRTIAVNLYAEQVQVLDQLAKRHGSRSAVVQSLLDEARRRNTYQELDEAYSAYVSADVESSDQALTAELLAAASWPQEWIAGGKEAGGKGGRKAARRKGRKTR
jgi:hypothetical protein